MNILKKQNKKKGFTLLEALIAIALSAYILAGLYSMLFSTLFVREKIDTVNNDIYITQAFQRFVARDIRMKSPKAVPTPMDYSNSVVMAMKSQNSLNFNKSIQVNIIYFLENNIIYRHEIMEEMNYSMKLPLLENVQEFMVETFDGKDYKEGFLNQGLIYRFTFKINNVQKQFVTGVAINILE